MTVGKKYAFVCLVLLLAVTSSVLAQFQAGFTADKPGGCSPLTISFSNTSTGTNGIAIYRWDFGNGNISTLPNPSAIFIAEKVYTVTLTVTQGNQVSTRNMNIEVYKKPTVDFSPNIVKGCLPLDVQLTAQAQPGSGVMSSYYWDFGYMEIGRASCRERV